MLYRIKEFGSAGASGYSYLQEESYLRRALTADEAKGAVSWNGKIFTRDNLTSQSIGRDKGEGAASWFPVAV